MIQGYRGRAKENFSKIYHSLCKIILILFIVLAVSHETLAMKSSNGGFFLEPSERGIHRSSNGRRKKRDLLRVPKIVVHEVGKSVPSSVSSDAVSPNSGLYLNIDSTQGDRKPGSAKLGQRRDPSGKNSESTKSSQLRRSMDSNPVGTKKGSQEEPKPVPVLFELFELCKKTGGSTEKIEEILEKARIAEKMECVPVVVLLLSSLDETVRGKAKEASKVILDNNSTKIWVRFFSESFRIIEKVGNKGAKFLLNELKEYIRKKQAIAWLPLILEERHSKNQHRQNAAADLVRTIIKSPKEFSRHIIKVIVGDQIYSTKSESSEVVSMAQEVILSLRAEYTRMKTWIEQEAFPDHSIYYPMFIMLFMRNPMLAFQYFPFERNIQEWHRTLSPVRGSIDLVAQLIYWKLDVPAIDEEKSLPTIRFVNFVHHFFLTLESAGLITPKPKDYSPVLYWLELAYLKNPVTLFTPLCPDYSIKKSSSGKVVFTFDDLGEDIGLTGARLLQILPYLSEFFSRYGCNVSFFVGFADFEALDSSTLKKLGITQDEFMTRLRESKKCLVESLPPNVEVQMITDMCEGVDNWCEMVKYIRKNFEGGNFGKAKLTSTQLGDILRARKDLFERWYPDASPKELEYHLLTHGANYAAVGEIVLTTFLNPGDESFPLMLSVDHESMKSFYNPAIPTLYAKPYYK